MSQTSDALVEAVTPLPYSNGQEAILANAAAEYYDSHPRVNIALDLRGIIQEYEDQPTKDAVEALAVRAEAGEFGGTV